MNALETLIAEAGRSGLRGLTLYPTRDGRWQASSTTDGVGWRVEFGDDPISALTQVLSIPPSSEMTVDNDQQGIFG